MLGVIIKIGKRSDAPYIKVNFMVISNNRHHVYTADPS